MSGVAPLDDTSPVACRVEIWDSSYTTKLGDLGGTHASGESWQPLSAKVRNLPSAVGAGEVVLLRSDFVTLGFAVKPRMIAKVIERQIAGAFSAVTTERTRGAFIIESLRDVIVGDGGEGDTETVTLSGRTHLARFDDAITLPWIPPEDTPVTDTRYWGWSSPRSELPEFTAPLWTQPRTNLLWGGNRPIAWPDPYDSWVWTRAPTVTHPAGDCYFRVAWNLVDDGDYVMFHSADDDFIFHIDGVEVEKELMDPPSDIWWWTWRAGIRLRAGWHTFAWKVHNVSAVGPGALLFSLWRADPQAGLGAPIFVSGDPTLGTPIAPIVAADYPATVPGVTAGAILLDLQTEAAARGVLAGTSLVFDRVNDSNGNPWPTLTFSRPVGTSTMLDTILALCDSYIDVYMDLDALSLFAVSKGTIPSSGSTLSAPTDLVDGGIVSMTTTVTL